tara:strand:+ start:5103 stop:6131 length:1029 start_codon:yes stop_codon:yes gene_type:complete
MLYEALLKVAHEVPPTRAVLVPLLREAKGKAKTPEGAKSQWEKYKRKHPKSKLQPSDFYEKPAEGEAPRAPTDKEKSKQDKGEEKTDKARKKKDRQDRDNRGWGKARQQEGRAKAQEFLKGVTPEKLKSEVDKILKDFGSGGLDSALKALSKRLKNHGSYTPDATHREDAYQQAVLSKYKKERGSKSDTANKKTKLKELASKHKLTDKGLSELKAWAKKTQKNKLSPADKGFHERNKGQQWRLNESDQKRFDRVEFAMTSRKKSDAEKKREFMQHTDPETKKRVMQMSPAEFAEMMAAIMDDEEGGGKQARIASMADEWLRSAVLAAAHEHPHLRRHVLPHL